MFEDLTFFNKISAYFLSPIFESDPKKTRAAEVVNTLLLSALIFIIVSIVGNIFIFVRKDTNTIIIAFLILINVYVRKLNRAGHVYLTSKIFIFCYLAFFQLIILFSTGMRSILFTSLAVMVVLAGVLLGSRWAAGIAIINISFGLIIALLELSNQLPPVFFPGPPLASWFMFVIILFLLVPPLNLSILRLQKSLELSDERLKERTRAEQDLQSSYETTLQGWANALELKDKATEGHSRRVTVLALKLGAEMDLTESRLKDLYYGALLHDIGKMGIPDSILAKKGKLNEQERKIIDEHPNIAYRLLKGTKYLQRAIDIPYSHHERWDGSGYPRGLKSEKIPLLARIFAVVDVWDALNSDRPYREAWLKTKAIKYLKDQSGKHFDPEIVKVFFSKVLELEESGLK